LSSSTKASGRKVVLVVCCAFAGSEAVAHFAQQGILTIAIEAKVKALQEKVGYSGNYREWIAKVEAPV